MPESIVRIDLSGLECPQVAMEAKRRLMTMAPGEILEVTATDPMAVLDLPMMARSHKHELLEVRETPEGNLIVIKVGSQAVPDDTWPQV